MHSGTSIPSWPEGLALQQGSSPKSGEQEVDTSFCWTFPHIQDGKPGGMPPPIASLHENPPYVPCVPGQALCHVSSGTLLRVPSTHPAPGWGACLGFIAFSGLEEQAGVSNIWWTGKVMELRSAPGFLCASLSTRVSSGPFIGRTRQEQDLDEEVLL
ncbi:hypothetical protein AMECASPLE_037680 [Ameca splendens]|uniref:Uncharacterized protein n=1 Tax=Ameca splendens TaxID=208324 RepID=A0ABV0Y7U9_9TELE